MNPFASDDRPLRSAMVRALFFVYKRLLSPFLHAASGSVGACRFQPTCSEYAAVAIERHGILRGTLLALRRIAKCHPFHPAAFDPVPELRPPSPSEHSKQSSAPLIKIEETGFRPVPAAGSRPIAATLPYERR